MKHLDINDYLKLPYGRLIVPEVDGTFRGEITEFPGCLAIGDTPSEAFTALEEAARSWLEAALENGQSIPAPSEDSEFSGKLVLRLPKSLHKKASRLAERDRVSLNQFIVASIAEHVGERNASARYMILSSLVHFGGNMSASNFWSTTSNNLHGSVNIIDNLISLGDPDYSKNVVSTRQLVGT